MAKNQPSTCFVPCFRTNHAMGEHVGAKIYQFFYLKKAIVEKSQYIQIEYINIYVQSNFYKDPYSIKEVAHDQAHDHIDHVAHCPIPQGEPSLIFSINHDTHLPTFPIAHMSKKMSSCQKDVKLSKRCQVVKKMSKNQTHGLWRRFRKKIN